MAIFYKNTRQHYSPLSSSLLKRRYKSLQNEHKPRINYYINPASISLRNGLLSSRQHTPKNESLHEHSFLLIEGLFSLAGNTLYKKSLHVNCRR